MITLREILAADIPIINSWRNDRDTISSLGTNFRYINPETDQQWFDAYMNSRDKNVYLAIINSSQSISGIVYLKNIDYLNSNAEFAIQICPDERKKGIGLAASKKCIDHAFLDLNLQRLYITVLEDNTPAISMYKKLGFVDEGTLQRSIYKNGAYKNQRIMALLK